MRGLYFEEFTVGMRFEHALTRTVPSGTTSSSRP